LRDNCIALTSDATIYQGMPPINKAYPLSSCTDDGHELFSVPEESEAERLWRKIRILCMVMTTPEHHESRAIHVMATWGRRCTKLLFVSEQLDSRLPIILINVTTGRKELSVKHRLAWDYVYK
jgi:glycoprotein-N-acetylgalactosamine 3-beta-galactosyltransferase